MLTKEDVLKGIKTLIVLNVLIHNGEKINKTWQDSIRNAQWILEQLVELNVCFENAQKPTKCERDNGWD